MIFFSIGRQGFGGYAPAPRGRCAGLGGFGRDIRAAVFSGVLWGGSSGGQNLCPYGRGGTLADGSGTVGRQNFLWN